MTKPLTICYADDDIVDLEIFKEILSTIDNSLSIHLHTSGDELLEHLLLPVDKPDLIFLDLNMPEKNGFQVLQAIHVLNVSAVPPVIIFSSSDDQDHKHCSLQLGAKMYIEKPYRYEAYIETMKSVLSTCQA